MSDGVFGTEEETFREWRCICCDGQVASDG